MARAHGPTLVLIFHTASICFASVKAQHRVDPAL